jgi:sulfite reductase alpha subunit-like flavoprotein
VVTPPEGPALVALQLADNEVASTGLELNGFLSHARGFLPRRPPPLSFAASHRPWDEASRQLPELYRDVCVRRVLDDLPCLPADREALADSLLGRAATVLGVLAHAYVRSEPDPADLPDAIAEPWAQVAARLGRPWPFLAYDDLIVGNWRRTSGDDGSPLRVENLRLLAPSVDNQAERIFYLAQVEMLDRSAPAVAAVARAQAAAMARDTEAVAVQLVTIIDAVRAMADDAFAKVNPNPYSDTYVDQVIWANTVAPFAVPLAPDRPGPSGLSSPAFHLLDVFFARPSYRSSLGKEAMRIRALFAPAVRRYLAGVGAVSVPELILESGDRTLRGLLHELFDTYAGTDGALGVHRRKVFGYLEIAFKTGRTVTVGGFSDAFTDHAWRDVDTELETARQERTAALTAPYTATVLGRRFEGEGADGVACVTLDVPGLRHHPGDRLLVLPSNDEALVERTIAALGARGEERLPLTPAWRDAVASRTGHGAEPTLDLRTFLRWARIRPVLREVAKALLQVTGSSDLREMIEARDEDQWELCDVVDLLGQHGYDTTRLWRSQPWQAESLARIVPPDRGRQYSISSAPASAPAAAAPGTVDVTVQVLSYASAPTSGAPAREHHGVASTWMAARAPVGGPLQVEVRRSRRFAPPADPTVPLLLFAAGTGIAPFRAFLQLRATQPQRGPTWLFLGARSRDRVLYLEDLRRLVGAGVVEMVVALSGEDLELRSVARHLVERPASRRRLPAAVTTDPEIAATIRRLIGAGGHTYICGQPVLARGVRAALEEVMATDGGADCIRRLSACGRLVEEVFTPFEPAVGRRLVLHDFSEIGRHNDEEHGRWMVIDGAVYDVTEFRHVHPGGARIVDENCGSDATEEWRAVAHHEASDVAALLSTYRIGSVRRLDFSGRWGIAIAEQGMRYVPLASAFAQWVRFLHLIVKMENATANDFGHLALPATGADPEGELTPYHLILAANTHRRFVADYVDAAVGPQLIELWRVTAGLTSPTERAGRMAAVLAAVRADPLAGEPGRLSDAIRNPDRGTELAHQAMRLDRQFLIAVKQRVCVGVAAFERHQGDVLAYQGRELRETLLAIPTELATYYRATATCLASLPG